MARASSSAVAVMAAAMVLLLAIGVPVALAKPNDWYDRGLSKSCFDHPSATTRNTPHKKPIEDSNIVFTVTDSNGDAVTTVCPGNKYDVKIDFHVDLENKPKKLEARSALISASAGTLKAITAKDAETKKNCPNRFVIGGDRSAQRSSVTAVLELPCKIPQDTTTVEVRVTSANTYQWKQNSASLAVGDAAACPKKTLPKSCAKKTASR